MIDAVQSDPPGFLMQGAVNYLPSKDNIIIQPKVCGKGAVVMEKEMEGKDEASTTNATEEGADAAGACRSSAGSRGTGPRTPTRSPGPSRT